MNIGFFGRGASPIDINPTLIHIIKRFAGENGDLTLYIGTQGGFDNKAYRAMRCSLLSCPDIRCKFISAYSGHIKSGSVFKCGKLRGTPRKRRVKTPESYVISFRDKFMLENCDVIVCYLEYGPRGAGAENLVEKARKNGKTIINLAE